MTDSFEAEQGVAALHNQSTLMDSAVMQAFYAGYVAALESPSNRIGTLSSSHRTRYRLAVQRAIGSPGLQVSERTAENLLQLGKIIAPLSTAEENQA